MLAKVYTATLIGFDAKIVEVEVDIARGERKINIVGLPDKAIKESKDRMISAFRNCEIDLGPGTKVVNLAPADLPKTGPAYDLPMAVGLLKACGHIPNFDFHNKLFLGELSLDGTLRGIKGVLPIISSAAKQGFKEVYLPKSNELEACLVKDITIHTVSSLHHLIDILQGNSEKENIKHPTLPELRQNIDYSFLNVKGQLKAKRAFEIAAVGGHNILICGIPGSGKTFLAKSLPSILPDMTFDECIEVTRIYSIAGEIDSNQPLINSRPFRSPHHSASMASIIGGGANPRPGEVSLAHCGVLFLDEIPEFNPEVLESLRQPLEDKSVTVSRVNGRIMFPANFQLVATMNPCRCGYFGSMDKDCKCTKYERERYIQRLSGPLLDRFDLFVNVQKVKFDELNSEQERSLKRQYFNLRDKIKSARNMQIQRFKKFDNTMQKRIFSNSDIPGNQIYKLIKFDDESKTLLNTAITKFNLSARGYYKVLRVARTIADIDMCEDVKYEHIAEALNFRLGSSFN